MWRSLVIEVDGMPVQVELSGKTIRSIRVPDRQHDWSMNLAEWMQESAPRLYQKIKEKVNEQIGMES